MSLVRDFAVSVIPGTRAMRDNSAQNVHVFTKLHELALSVPQLNLTPFTNCVVHVSIMGRDLANFELCILENWSDTDLTPTLISHFYLSTYKFLERWPEALQKKSVRSCLQQWRADGFGSEIKSLNAEYLAIRQKWWDTLTQVRNNLSGHFDADASKLLSTFEMINFMSFIELSKSVNDLQEKTVTALTLMSNEMQIFIQKFSSALK